jgi:chemotaxis protein methyltransferase CheR
MSTATIDSPPKLKRSEFEHISRLAYDTFGIDLGEGKHALVEARLGKKLRELRLPSFQHYYDHVVSDPTGAALTTMIDVLTTNHTSFFREPRHFEFLREVVFPALRHRPEIHIWSAACSSGEEPYTIAMSLLEQSREEALSKVRIRATDISTRVLGIGSRGIYPAERIKSIPPEMLKRYLLKGQNAAAHTFRFKKEVRGMISFEHCNLMQPFHPDYRCPVIFCRNVMIYFDKPTQEDLVARLTMTLEDGGYLFIGHSESLNALEHGLEYVSPATYRKPGGGRTQQIMSKTGRS